MLQFNSIAVRDIFSEVGNDIFGDDAYEDVRHELVTVHNLTSVLMNPRESLIEELMDEFILEQLQPLDLPHLNIKATSLSMHSTFELSGGSSHHFNTSHMISMSSDRSQTLHSHCTTNGGSAFSTLLFAFPGATLSR